MTEKSAYIPRAPKDAPSPSGGVCFMCARHAQCGIRDTLYRQYVNFGAVVSVNECGSFEGVGDGPAN